VTSTEQPNKDAEAQNKKAQEAAQKSIEEAAEKQKAEQLAAVEGKAPEKDYTFQAAAKELEEVEQPPNQGSAYEEKARQAASGSEGAPAPGTAPVPPTTTAPKPMPRR
jgi:hypothetical protein